jgi:hypothetical protein
MYQRKSIGRSLPTLKPWQIAVAFVVGCLLALGGVFNLITHEHSGGMWDVIGDAVPFAFALAFMMPRFTLRILEAVLAKLTKKS